MANNLLYMGKIMEVFQESIQSVIRLASDSVKFCIMPISGGPIEAHITEMTHDPCNELDALLRKYQQVFQTPNTLPLPRTHDHRIPLEPGSGPVSVHPYRYPYVQKNEIERAVTPRELYDQVSAHFHRWSSWFRRRMALGIFAWTIER